MPSEVQGAPTTAAVLDLLAEAERPLHRNEIAARLGVAPRHVDKLTTIIDELVYDGALAPHAGQRYRLAESTRRDRGRRVQAVIHVHPRGFAFVRALGPDEPDWYVAPEALAGAMHGDLVEARLVARTSRGLEGEVVAVIERGRRRVAGVLGSRGRHLEPDDPRIRGPVVVTDTAPGIEARRGLCAVAEITRYPERAGELCEGRLVCILGEPGEPAVEVAKILAEHEVDEEHPPDAENEALGVVSPPTDDERRGREDLTTVELVTIDPVDARDFDDAVWAERRDDGSYRAIVAVADVSHYVRPGTALDDDARRRGCSVYLPDRAVPMLPARLASTVCSLVPGEARLCLAVHVELDPEGSVTGTRLSEAVMRSAARMSYGGVARALGFTLATERQPEADDRRELLGVLWDLSSILRRRRMRRGALELDVPEARVAVDAETEAPTAITQRAVDPGVRKAYRLVEELMLLANEVVATEAERRRLPVIYRVHGPPDPEKVARFAAVAGELGLRFDMDEDETLSPKKLSRFLRKIEGHPKKQILDGVLLRSLQQACYDIVNIGHFGLASRAYLHFTSPIRRYPDLVVHRQLRASLRNQPIPHDEDVLGAAAVTASERERQAMEVERQVVDLYRALYMRGHIGESFEAVVVAVSPSGLFARIAEPFVDVMVTAEALGRGPGADEFEPDELGLALVGLRSGQRIELGAALLVVVEDTSLVRRSVYARRDLAAQPEPRRRGAGKHGRSRGGPAGPGKSGPRDGGGGRGRGTKSTTPGRGSARSDRGAGRGGRRRGH